MVVHADPLDRAIKILKFKKSKMAVAAILKIEKIASLTDHHHHTLSILANKTADIIKTKLESVSLSYKSHHSRTANINILSANSKHTS